MKKLKPRQRVLVYQLMMYGIAAVVVLVVVTQADWPKIQKNFFNTEIAADMFPR